MTTGKVEYAPDYKSVRRDSKGLPIDDRGWPIMEVVDYDPLAEKAKREEQARVFAEHQRLKDAVVDAAREARIVRRRESSEASEYLRALADTMHAERDAVDALIDFESSQQQIKK